MEEDAEQHVKSENYSKAVPLYTKLLDSAPNEASKWLCARGNCYLQMKKSENALEDGKKAKDSNPKDLEAHLLCGRALVQQGLYVDALEHYREALKVEPNNKVIIEDLKKLQNIITKEQEKEIGGGKSDSTYNAVSLCSQGIYPGDEKIINLEKEILEVKYKILEDDAYDEEKVRLAKKNPDIEAKLIQAAYECLRAEKQDEALTIVSKAISMDPKNVFYRNFRAQVYFNMKQWAKCIQDYWVIPKPQRKPDVWKQGGKAFVELWLPVLAEFWFRKATQLSGGKDEEAAMLFQKVRVRRLYDPLCENQPVKVEFTQFGRAVFAKEDISKGQTVMIDIPLVSAQSLETRHIPACANCAASLLPSKMYFGNKMKQMDKEQLYLIEECWPCVAEVWCPHCGREKYCSKICLDEAWMTYHSMICPKTNPAATQLYDLIDHGGYGHSASGQWQDLWGGHFSPMILAKIWAQIASQVKFMMEQEGSATPTLEHWAKAKAPFRRFIAFGTVPAVKRMPHMLPIYQKIFENCPGLSYEITPDEFNGRYYQAACNLQCFSPAITPYHRFLNNIKDDIRGVGMIRFLAESPPEAQFAAMCPLHACSNHSCLNNAEVCDHDIDGRPGVQMIAKRDIKKGEEIFITYIDTSMPKLLRKAWLYKSFNFWCQCQRCLYEGEQPTECTNCHKKAPEGKPFAACGKCKRAWYCGTKCQKDSWKKGHKIACMTEHSKAKY